MLATSPQVDRADALRLAGKRVRARVLEVRRAVPSLLLAAALSGCGAPAETVPSPGHTGVATADSQLSSPTAAAPSAPGTSESTEAPSDATPSATALAEPAEGEFVNPVLDIDFPDPHVIEVEGTYHAYATAGNGHNIQHSTSTDMVTWTPPMEVLPDLPAWSPGRTWAPEVARTSAGFVMYYTLAASEFRRPGGQAAQCISYAVAQQPDGPFEDSNDEPLVCQNDLGGSIDAHHFVDDDETPYLVWKNDGNCCSRATQMWLAELSPDGTTLVGEPTDLGVTNDQVWEFNVIEAPSLLLHDGTYYLFYSANLYDGGRYAVGYATAGRVSGPFEDAPENPILQAEGRAAGPGHQSIAADADGDYWLYYHAWESGSVGYQAGGRRALWLDELAFEAGRPVVLGPDGDPQPAPDTGD